MPDKIFLSLKNEVEKKGISLALGKSKESDLNIIMIFFNLALHTL
jgi:hypothetical protein